MPQPKKHADRAAKQAAYRARLAAAPKPEPQVLAGAPKTIPSKPGKARHRALLTLAQAALEALRDELQEHFDERSEAWQERERGQEAQERIDAVESALEALEGVPEL